MAHVGKTVAWQPIVLCGDLQTLATTLVQAAGAVSVQAMVTPEFDPDTPDTVAVILRTQTAVDWLNALVVALGVAPTGPRCNDPDADVRGVRPANSPCP